MVIAATFLPSTMPELPEVEHVRCTLAPVLVGARIDDVRLVRRDIVTGPATSKPHSAPGIRKTSRTPRIRRADLLRGQTIIALHRHGKQLAIEGNAGGVLCIHLGMTGQLFYLDRGARPPNAAHIHSIWRTERNGETGRLMFRDPRRFGGIWVFESMDQLEDERWNMLGVDALDLRVQELRTALTGRKSPIKAALLNQNLIAGLGNIYVDEALFAAAIHPLRRADDLDRADTRRLAHSIRRVLRAALRSGGSTLRDYVDAQGRSGEFTSRHRVYGRAGLPCVKCGTALVKAVIAQRTTCFCSHCQP